MKQINATAFSVGIVGAICTWFFLSVGTILVWAAFVSWACFFHSGGDNAALKSTIFSNIFGCFIGWLGALTLLVVPGAALSTPEIWAGAIVFLTVVIYILASQFPPLASVPGTTYGYACTFAYLLQTPGKLDPATMTSASFANVIVVVPVSMVLGALFGYASAKLAATLSRPALQVG